MSEAQSLDRIKQTIEAEADSIHSSRQALHPSSFDKPAIGIVANGQDPSRVAGAILRANREGFQALVTYDPDHVDPEAIDFAEQLGSVIVKPEFNRWNGQDPTEILWLTAREYGLPGVIHHQDLSTPTDFDASVKKLQRGTDYLIEAEPEPAVAGPVDVLVGIPAYKEAKTIADVVERSSEHGKVLVVDDGSDDDTASVAREAGATVVEHETNRGYGAALKTIFKEADRSGAEHLVILDADGQHEPADVQKLVEKQGDSGADLVIGSRFKGDAETEAPLYRRIGLAVVNVLTNLSLGAIRSRSRVRDTQSGFRVYSAEAVRSLSADAGIGDHMGASTDILQHAHKEGYDIEEVGTTVNYQVENGSNHDPVSHGVTLVMNLLRTIEQQRPVTVLGIPGFVSAFVGLGFGYWTFSTYIQSGAFPLGLAVTSSFFGLAGIFACFTAIILHALNQHPYDQ